MSRIADVTITPVAFRDPPLLNSNGVHEPFALRAIVECRTDDGIVGLGETYGELAHLERLRAVSPRLAGLDPFSLNELHRRVAESLGEAPAGRPSSRGQWSRAVEETFGAFEVAFYDICGKATGRTVAELLGGAVRDSVAYSAYLFYRWAEHPAGPGDELDDWGAALDPDGIVAQASRMIESYGFTSLKLKGGVFPPGEEVEAIHALRAAFPDHPLRIDPNASWSVPTSLEVARALDGELEYLEDPTDGIEAMAAVAAESPMPLATNMCVVEMAHIPPAVEQRAVGIVLADHHYWGGLTGSRRLAGICETFGIGLSMHSNSHLGISLAAMTHLAAATPNLGYACDTHRPWQAAEDVIAPGVLELRAGSVALPTSPGLGVELDRDALGVLAEQYERCGVRNRDDTGYMQKFDPGYERRRPRW